MPLWVVCGGKFFLFLRILFFPKKIYLTDQEVWPLDNSKILPSKEALTRANQDHAGLVDGFRTKRRLSLKNSKYLYISRCFLLSMEQAVNVIAFATVDLSHHDESWKLPYIYVDECGSLADDCCYRSRPYLGRKVDNRNLIAPISVWSDLGTIPQPVPLIFGVRVGYAREEVITV